MSKYIKLGGKIGKGLFAIVDESDYENLLEYSWCARKYVINNRTYFYACTRIGKKIYFMHRMIMGVHLSSLPDVDHRNHDTLDNQKHNLRLCTDSQNMANREAYNKFSIYKGIRPVNHYFGNPSGKWEAFITINKKQKYLGRFNTDIDAAMAYDTAAKTYHGDFARLNFSNE